MTDELQEAIDRARNHSLNAGREGLEALRAMVDVILILGGRDATQRTGAIPEDLLALLDDWIRGLEQERIDGTANGWADPLFEALTAEIERWEFRAATDAAARPVLTGFLGLRRLLSEIGVQPSPRSESKKETSRSRNDSMRRAAETTPRERSVSRTLHES